ncbi:Alpha N-terminal protein methyltransferase 1 [Arachnomyces sp. PD_36]|nr:Alpha N-terminal protein methyltransferase 1 [Arachnomyces sp. PD_36]
MSNRAPQRGPDSLVDNAASVKYWSGIPPNEDGMLGGYPQISRIDLRGSANFLAKIHRLFPSTAKVKPLERGVDCGAGIGRVSEGFLKNVCATVDVVEPVELFALEARRKLIADERAGDMFIVGLESWKPTKKYDLIWVQWCVGYLTDEQLSEFLKRCKQALTEQGIIVLKENLSTDGDRKDVFDETDGGVTRTDEKYRSLFKKAGLELLRSEEQTGFPKSLGLMPVKFYALR